METIALGDYDEHLRKKTSRLRAKEFSKAKNMDKETGKPVLWAAPKYK